MLWPFVLPVQITFWALVVFFLAVIVVAPLVKQERWKAVSWGLCLWLVAFVPCCTGVKSVLDNYRFGVFEYVDFRSVKESHVRQFLPEAATEITVEQTPAGFRAKFKIDKQTLDDWLDQYWERYGKHSVEPRESDEEPRPIRSEEFEYHFGDLDWPPLSHAVEYEGPRAANGAGFTIWYSESEGIVYQQAGYW